MWIDWTKCRYPNMNCNIFNASWWCDWYAITCYTGNCKKITLSQWGFSIPSSATIDAINLSVTRKASMPETAKDTQVILLKNGVPTGDNGFDDNYWSTSWETIMYPNLNMTSLDWGISWLPSDINDPTFGIISNPEV